MKFVKESIELKGIEESIEECIHPVQEEKNKISKRWGHTWYFDRLGNVEKVRAKDGTVLHRGERFQSDKDFYVINGFDPDTDTVFVVEPDNYDPHDVEGGADYAVEDVVEIFKGWDKQSLDGSTDSSNIIDETINEEIERGIYRVTYVVDKDANIFSAVMINARGEADAQSIFLKKFPDTEILGIRELDDREIETNKKKGMSLIEDLDNTGSGIYKITVREKDAPDIFSSFMVKANSEAEAKQLYQDKYSSYGELVGIRDVADYEVKEFKRRGMKLYEDLDVDELESEEEATKDNPEPPVAGEESAAASIINSLIRDEWLAIEQYNTAMVNLKEYGIDEKIIEVLNHIMMDENTHVGNLQEVLALLAPATDKIEKGNEQAEQILGTENEEVGV